MEWFISHVIARINSYDLYVARCYFSRHFRHFHKKRLVLVDWKDWERDSQLVLENMSWYEVLTSNSCHLIPFHVQSAYATKYHNLWLFSREYDSQGHIPCKNVYTHVIYIYTYIYVHINIHLHISPIRAYDFSQNPENFPLLYEKTKSPKTSESSWKVWRNVDVGDAGTSQRMPKAGDAKQDEGNEIRSR